MRRAGWYAARLGAMSRPEVAWRARSAVARRVRPSLRPPLPVWGGPWGEHLQALVAEQREGFVAAAERLAGGEVELWGQAVDPAGLPERFPGPDTKPLLELNRQQHLVPLAAGAALTGNDAWARLVIDDITAWIRQNPLESGRPWLSGYESAHRLVGWAWAMPLVRSHATSAELELIGDAYAQQAAVTAAMPSRYSSANNHRIVELTGLLAAATVVSPTAPWHETWTELEHEVTRQTYGDGGSREQAAGYFLYVLETLWVAGVFAQANRHPLGALRERLECMLEWLHAVADENGEPPALGDDAEDRILRLDYFEPRRAPVIAGRVRALLDAPSEAPSRSSRVLQESGFAVLRSDDVRIVFDIGELGFGSLAAHGHADALSVLADRAGTSLLRDSGTGAYAPPFPRELLKGTTSHNSVVVDEQSQARSLGSHLWGRRFEVTLEAEELDESVDYVRASHDGYRRTPSRALHTRSVVYLKPHTLLVLDRIQAAQSCDATLVWQRWNESRAQIDVRAAPPAAGIDGRGACSPRYTEIDEAPRSTWTSSGDEVVFASAIGLGARDALISSFAHDGRTTRVVVNDWAVDEDWQSARPRIERCAV